MSVSRLRIPTAVAVLAGVGALLTRMWPLLSKIPRKETATLCACQPRLAGVNVVITGATSGIGYQVAFIAAKQGANVLIGARNKNRGEQVSAQIRKESGNQNVTFEFLDLTDFESCILFAEQVKRKVGSAFILVNNAAIFNSPQKSTVNGYEITWQTNYLSHVLITEYILRCENGTGIQPSKKGNVIFLSSDAKNRVHFSDLIDPLQFRKVSKDISFESSILHYGKTKLALHMYASYLSSSSTDVYIVSVDPGNTWTNIYRTSFWNNISDILKRVKCSFLMRSPIEGAQSVIHCMNAPNRLPSGSVVFDCKIKPNEENQTTETYERDAKFVRETLRTLSAYLPR